ncbi:MAG: thiamine diphosphokinase [Chloroflexi bacterium]|nr:thiamine diphosphokinase [Chloroflexota bacterium]
MRALLIANGETPSPALLAALAAEADVVVAADGGADKALALGIVPHAVVGDLDSVTEATRNSLPADSFHPVDDRDTTDLEKAIVWCMAAGVTRIDIVGAGGGRADHALANLSVLVEFRDGPELHIADDYFDIRLVQGTARIDAPVGTVVSLVALGACTGVTTSGLRWELVDHPLPFSPYGVHNEVVESPAMVTVAAGDLLLFEGRFIEKHR